MKIIRLKNYLKLGILLLGISLLFYACENDNEYVGISNSSENKLLDILVKSTSEDYIFKSNEIAWDKLKVYNTETGYFVSVPVKSIEGNDKGKVMFEIIEKTISKKYLVYSLDSATVKSVNSGLDFDTHDLLNYLNKNKKSSKTYSKSSDFPNMGNLCAACHSGMLNFDGNTLDEVVIIGNSSDDWANDYWNDPNNPISWGPGGTINISAIYYNNINIPLNNTAKIDPDKELKCYDLTKSAKLTIYVQQPNENTNDIIGSNSVGHAFIGIEQNGIVRQLGFYPESGANTALVSVGVDYDSELRDNNNYLYHVSISKNISNNQLTSIVNYIKNTPNTYNVNNYACTDFAIKIGNLGAMNLPLTTISSFTFSGRSPGKLGQEIRAMNSNNTVTINKNKNNSPKSNGTCN
jgi:hypothetical protein